MLFWVEQAFVGSEEIRTPLKSPAWEATDMIDRSEKHEHQLGFELQDSGVFEKCSNDNDESSQWIADQ